MTELSDLYALRDMLKNAGGPSRKLDDMLTRLFGLADEFFSDVSSDFDGPENCGDGNWAGGGQWFQSPFFTYSIDDSLLLVDRLMPGWGWEILRLERDLFIAAVLPRSRVARRYEAPTAPLAILRALISALIATKEQPR